MGILLCITAGVLALVNGIACSAGSEDRKQIFAFNFLAPFFTMVLALVLRTDWKVVINGGVIEPVNTFIVLLFSGFCGLGYVLTLMFAMNAGPHSLSLCIGESCLVIPYLFSVIVWKDKMGVWGLAGVCLIVLAIVFIGLTKHRQEGADGLSGRWFLFITLAFILGGTELALSTIPSRWPGWEDTANLRPVLSQVGRMIILVPLLLKKIKPNKKTTVVAFTAAVVNVFVATTIYMAMDYLVKDHMLAVLYPITLGTYILLFTAYGIFYRKEKLMPASLAGMAAILTGIVLLSF